MLEALAKTYVLLTWKQCAIALVAIIAGGQFFVQYLARSAAQNAIEKFMPDATVELLDSRLRKVSDLERRLSDAVSRAEGDRWSIEELRTDGHTIRGNKFTSKSGESHRVIKVGKSSAGVVFVSMRTDGFQENWQIAFSRGRGDTSFKMQLLSSTDENSSPQCQFKINAEDHSVDVTAPEDADATLTAIFSGRVGLDYFELMLE